jgi:ADP-heptose:LPS heptosyltransferase
MTSAAAPGFVAIAERGIGDALTLLPSLRALRAVRPELRIELLAPGLFPLARNLSDTAAVLDHRPLDGLGDEARLEWLRSRDAEWVWNTEGARGPWTAALRRADYPGWVNAPPQQAWGSRNVLRVRPAQLRRLFPELPTPKDPVLRLTPSQEPVRREFRSGFPRDSLLVAIQPGAGDPNRIWPAEKFRELAAALAGRPRVAVVFFLSDAEARFQAPGFLPDGENVRVVTAGLETVLPHLAACDLCISNDSGFYHLAFALGSRVVAIHRSVRGARRWAYRSPRSRAVICWMPHQLDRDWARWVSVPRVLGAARRLVPELGPRPTARPSPSAP